MQLLCDTKKVQHLERSRREKENLPRTSCIVVASSLAPFLGSSGKERKTQLAMEAPKTESKFIDLRSDTVTWPTEEMRAAMAAAEVGDDVYGEDPTINKLEEEAARVFGKEAGLFLSSGTQGNLIALLVHCERGQEAIFGDICHCIYYEAGGVAAVGGIMPRTVPVQKDGTLLLEDIENTIRPLSDDHTPKTALICLENTQNKAGGVSLSAEYIDKVGELAKKHNLKLHIDGARIFNAAADQKTSVKELTKSADSVTFCLSKGLCAPVGSVLVGTREFIREARRKRKMLGGGMRQAGVLAAAGLIALEKMAQRLEEDHQHAKLLGDELQKLSSISRVSQATNMVYFDLSPDAKIPHAELPQKLREKGVLIGGIRKNTFRMVLHYWISEEHVHKTIAAFKEVLGN